MCYFAKAAAFDFTYNQLTTMWNQLNVQLRRDISMSDSHITLAAFLNQLKEKISIWEKMADRQQRQHQQQQRPQFFNKHVNFNISGGKSFSRVNSEKTYIVEAVEVANEDVNEGFVGYCDYENEYSVN